MKKIFMMLLMAVAAVSAWGQEENENTDAKDKSLRQKYEEFLFHFEEKDSLPKLWDFISKEEWSIFDEENGIVAVVRLLPKKQVAKEYKDYLIALQQVVDHKIDFAYNNGLFDCCLSASRGGEFYTVVKL